MPTIRWIGPTEIDAHGRNGTFKQTGLQVFMPRMDPPEVILHGITSQGQPSRSARLVIPHSKLGEVIDILTALRNQEVDVP